ncbi:glycosyltransferase family 4 protein [Clostridium sp. LY3-2]|uniref:glycosyltransferase family 4 protein n=1 Tax=Clostridium sp. LY3-2 TaxID=2942482 RepID=UPI0021523499|nr:glycosyltransferase family 4 protein [Clostridium sp. LY3-2]MCR6513716.1 glycosyltransferase family 4 protein [Clostridium sp. LY3-2]
MITLQLLDSVGLGGVEKIAYYIHQNNLRLNSQSYIAINKDYYYKFTDYYNLNDNKNIILLDFSSSDAIIKKIIAYIKVINYVKPNIIHTHARRECISICLIKKIFRNIKHIRTQHMEELGGRKKTYVEKKLYKNGVDEWIVTSNKLLEDYLFKYVGNIRNAKIIYNGIESNASIKKESKKSNVVNLGFVGRITRQKGLDILIKNLNNLNDTYLKKIKLDIYGDGPELETLKVLVNDAKLNRNIEFHGYTKLPLEKIREFDILIMPSRYEGVPLVMLESMSIGVPVAISNVGGVSEIIDTENDGWIIYNNKWDSFLKDIINGKYDIEEIGKNSIRKYNKRFTKDIMCENYYKEYGFIIEGKYE